MTAACPTARPSAVGEPSLVGGRADAGRSGPPGTRTLLLGEFTTLVYILFNNLSIKLSNQTIISKYHSSQNLVHDFLLYLWLWWVLVVVLTSVAYVNYTKLDIYTNIIERKYLIVSLF